MSPRSLFVSILTAVLGTGQFARAQSRCGQAALPPQARALLGERFPKWRIKLPSDLDDFDKQAWAQEHPKDCPGLAIGHFEDAIQVAYGLFLVPKSSAGSGSKLVVLAESKTAGGYVVRMLAEERGPESGMVISKVPPGKYPGFDTTQSVRLKLDGLEAEWLEKSSVLYYWRNGKYRTLQTSD